MGASRGPQDNNAGQAHSWQARLLHFYGLGLPPAVVAKVGYQTKQFIAQSEFDLGPPLMPSLTKCRNTMNYSVIKYKDIIWFLYLTLYGSHVSNFCILLGMLMPSERLKKKNKLSKDVFPLSSK